MSGWHAKRNCEKCDFRVQQIDISGREVNMCILDNRQVGLIETCEKYKVRTGEHVTQN